MSREALQLRVDNLEMEKDELERANARLREANSEEAARLDAETEAARLARENEGLREDVSRLTSLYEQALQEIAAGAPASRECERDESQAEELRRLESELEATKSGAELDRLRAVEAERKKWEDREERLVRQMESLTYGIPFVSKVVLPIER